jgi:hypothetical protein
MSDRYLLDWLLLHSFFDLLLSTINMEFFNRQAFIREKAEFDASRMFEGHPPSPLPSPTFDSFHSQQIQSQMAPSRLDRVREHTRSLSARFCNYHSVYTNEEPAGSAFMLREQESGCRRESFEGQPVRGPRDDWVDRDSATSEGSERSDSEKGTCASS